MTRYIVNLSEKEEMDLRQMALTPGYGALLKLLQGESLDMQAKAMECEDPDKEKRLQLLTDAQSTKRVVSSLINKLSRYRESILSPQQEEDKPNPFGFEMYNTGKEAH